MEYPSGLIEQAVNEISRLPGIGKKTALRIVLSLLKRKPEDIHMLSDSLVLLREKTKYCRICHIISDTEECTCKTPNRDTSVICVVQDTPDVIAIRNTAQFNGMFHVLGGLISPMDGIGPDQLNVNSLIERVKNAEPPIREIILALSPTMEGDTTAYYMAKKLLPFKVRISTIARGIPIGGELEYADEVTLGRSITTRINYNLNEEK